MTNFIVNIAKHYQFISYISWTIKQLNDRKFEATNHSNIFGITRHHSSHALLLLLGIPVPLALFLVN